MGLISKLKRAFCETTGGKPVKQCAAVCPHSALKIEEVTFSGNHRVDKDTKGLFPAPEWKSGRATSAQSPICYMRNRKIRLTAKFKVTANPCANESVKIRGRETFGGINLEWTGSVTVGPSDTWVTTSTLVSDKAIPDKVACYDPADIAWHYNPGGSGWKTAGASANVCYATLADPTGTPAYWTLLDISCRAAAGATKESKLVEESFKPLKASIGKGKGPKRKRDGKRLTYYLKAAHTPSSGVFTTHDLLSRSDGTGRCGAWARFLVSMHKCHGITASAVFGVVPISSLASVFLVKNCNFSGTGSLAVPFPHKGNTECVKAAGLPGQGTDNPQFVFGDHALVRHSGKIYDPSYGVGPVGDMKTWESGAISGLGKAPYLAFSGTGGEPQFMPANCSRGFVEYTVAAKDSLSKIAAKHGISTWKSLYNHRYNASFKATRPDPNTIKTGDKLFIPREIASIRILRNS